MGFLLLSILKIFLPLLVSPIPNFFSGPPPFLLKGEGTHNVNCRKLISTLKTRKNVSDIEMYYWIPSLQVYHIKVSSYLGSLTSKILDLRVKNGSNFSYILTYFWSKIILITFGIITSTIIWIRNKWAHFGNQRDMSTAYGKMKNRIYPTMVHLYPSPN